jgi:MoaA/NifB/PqqE/SkfB family radical SAM enzyme
MSVLREMLPKMVRYRLAHMGLAAPGMPLNLTFSVTNLCQSRCRTCRIWDLYRVDPEKRQDELSLDEIEQIFKFMGHVYVFNVSGGEPFLRADLVRIIELACRYLIPGVIHIPTNGIAGDLIQRQVAKILRVIESRNLRVQLTVKPSLDHVGEKHDQIRGVPGNFEKVMTLFQRLKALKKGYPNLHAELGTVISRWNVKDIEEIVSFVKSLGPDSYRNEIAEQRSEMFNLDQDITPSARDYAKAISCFQREVRNRARGKPWFQRLTHGFRFAYYDLAVRILMEGRQVIPCYAGISNAHLTPYGDVWACCTLGYERSMGNLRDFGYDLKTLWNSPQAKEVRHYIRNKRCACPLANQAYSNMMLHLPSLMKVGWHLVKG